MAGITDHKNTLTTWRQSLLIRWRETIAARQRAVQDMQRLLASLAPEATLKRGYSITRAANGTTIRSASQVNAGDKLTTVLRKGQIASTADRLTK
jgi:exodeoxyribonuclease VII large subunit